MAQPRYSAVGDYVVGKQIGAGSFSTVWHGHHRVNGTEVAIKEIATARLNPKLQESLKSEIFILKRINHPNIVRLYDVIEEPGYLYIVLEFCKGGDLSMYIHKRHGEVSKATAKHFMQQLAEGLKVLRENNVIHRDLKPQNLLLSTNDDSSILKIADFGFARSLQPRDVAETLCGSPLYMAPEILQLQKYDAKADLWSVGTILFQLVSGKTPFTGSNQMQLLQNIIKSTELQFPPDAKDLSPHGQDLCRKLLRRNPVERLTFEEFFNHPYLSKKQHIDSSSQPQRVSDSSISGRNTEETSQENSLSSSRDNDSCLPVCSFPKRSAMRSMYGLSLDSKAELRDYLNLTNKTVADSLELIIKDYVIVSGHPLDLSYTGGCASKQEHSPSNDDLPLVSEKINKTSSSMSIRSGATRSVDDTGTLGSHISPPSTSQGSRDIKHPPSDSMTRVKSLQCYATTLRELVKGKAEKGKHLEAFSIQLVILSIWKQALDICQTYAASATEGNSSEETTRLSEVSNTQHNPDAQECHDISLQIERSFLHEVENSEELAKVIEPGNTEMPDAIELIYQSALAFGKRGAVDEYMGDNGNAVAFYSKAARLLQFLGGEAPRLVLNPPFSLTGLAWHRIRIYIYMLNDRQSTLESQRMALPEAADKGPSCPS